MTDEAHLDIETYSEAGYRQDPQDPRKRIPLAGTTKTGISAVGACAYAEHPSTEILCFAYHLPGFERPQAWRIGEPFPQDFADWIASGRPIRAHNANFEAMVWHHTAARTGWPRIQWDAWRCSRATANVNNYPGALGELARVLELPSDAQKDKDGKRLINLLCVPRVPRKNETLAVFPVRNYPADLPEDYDKLVSYCVQDVVTEMAATAAMRPMTDAELAAWRLTWAKNVRGVAVDTAAVEDLIAVMEQSLARSDLECHRLTGCYASQGTELMKWLASEGVYTTSLDAEHVEDLLSRDDLSPVARRVIEIKAAAASASVKKLYAMRLMTNRDSRLRDQYVHHGARTGRPNGQGVQLANLPKRGPDLKWCPLGVPYYADLPASPWTGEDGSGHKQTGWTWEAVPYVLDVARTRDLDTFERHFGPALLAISGVMRSLLVAAPGRRLISSDFSAIEAVVSAAVAGEQWRIDTIRDGKDIYLASIGKIFGKSYESYVEYKKETGKNHPDRAFGKIAELASGFGGWIGSWRNFGATGEDAEVKQQILAWRAASPNIVEMWGGQGRGFPGSYRYVAERYGLEGAFVDVVEDPRRVRDVGPYRLWSDGRALYIRLPSGRELTYHKPKLVPSDRRPGEFSILYWTYNSNVKMGSIGWVLMNTYGGRLFENVVQATAHDILRYAIENLTSAGYKVVMDTYDEIICEVENGSVEELESVMATMPPWAAGWPIRAAGGWCGERYRKAD